ncbi:MAG: glycosyltransferase family 39 protein [Anaerolineae bacterium]|nr:glycosyltransferase family 39 protein [Anaerolineae bacterium]
MIATESAARNATDHINSDRLISRLVLIAIVAIAASLRLVGLDWDEGHLLHPDERFLAWVAADLESVETIGGYFDTENSTLNPNNVGHGFYVYGNLPVIAAHVLGDIFDKSELFTIYMVGRYMSVGADLLTILILYWVAKRLFDRRIGLLTAALYAGCAFPIQQAHFFTVDPYTNLFAAAAFGFAVRALEKHRWTDYLLFGLMLGVSMSCKMSIYPLSMILVVALALRTLREQSEIDQTEGGEGVKQRRAIFIRAFAGLCIAGLVTVLVFRVGQPYAFLPAHSGVEINAEELGGGLTLISRIGDPVGFRPNPDWIRQMREVRIQVSGRADIPPNHQWGKRIPLVFPWTNMVRVGMGWPFGLFAWFAFGWAWWEIIRQHEGWEKLVLPAVWIGGYFVLQGIGWVTTMRYFLPLYGFLAMLAAWALITIWDRIQKLIDSRNAPRRHPAALVSTGLIACVVLATYGWGFAVSRIYTRPHSRVAASEWIVENIPSDVTLIFDTSEGQRTYEIGLPNNWSTGEEQDALHPILDTSYVSTDYPSGYQFELPFDGILTTIRINHMIDPAAEEIEQEPRTLDIKLTPAENSNAVLAEGRIDARFTAGDDPRGDTYSVTVEPVEMTGETRYTLTLTPDDAGVLVISGSSVATEGDWDDPIPHGVHPYNVWGAQFEGYELNLVWEDTPDKRAYMQYILDRVDYLTISSNRFYASLSRNPQRWPMTLAYYEALFSGELGFELIGDFSSRPTLGPIEFYDDTAEEAWTVYDHPRVFIFRKTAAYSSENTAAILGSVDLNSVVRTIAGDSEGRPVRLTLPPARRNADATRGVGILSPELSWTAYDPQRTDFFSRFQALGSLAWWLVIGMIGWLAFPTMWVIFRGTPDKGYLLSRIFGMLFTAWLAWMLASLRLVKWGRAGILLSLLVLTVLSAGLILPRRKAFVTWVRDNLRRIGIAEAGLFIFFLAFLLIRLGNPDLWHPYFGGEKPMDMAYFNAVLRSETFPPYDPWFAGGTINYYYFGFVLIGVPVKLLGVPSSLAYNLILPTFFALTAGGVFSAVYNLTAKCSIGNVFPPTPALPLNGERADIRGMTLPYNDEGIDSGELALTPDLAAARSAPSPSWRGGTGDTGRAQHAVPLRGVLRGQERLPVMAGLFAAISAVGLGNLDQIRRIIWGIAEIGHGGGQWESTLLPRGGDFVNGLIQVIQGQRIPIARHEWYWNATRLIPVPINAEGIATETGPITEFPFFTFLYGDLHAHMIAFPVTLLVIGWCIALIRQANKENDGPFGRFIATAVTVLVGAMTVGALRPTNTWDYPTYLVLAIVTLMIAPFLKQVNQDRLPALMIGGVLAVMLGAAMYGFSLSEAAQAQNISGLALAGVGALIGLLAGYGIGLRVTGGREDQDGKPWQTLFGGLGMSALFALGTYLLFLPYMLNYKAGYDQFIAWEGSSTPLWAFTDINGLQLFLIISWLGMIGWGWIKRIPRKMILPVVIGGMAVIGITAFAGSTVSPVAIVAVPVMLAALGLFIDQKRSREEIITGVLVLAAMGLALLVEIVVLEGDMHRMNTIFKFYLQIWLLLTVAGGAGLAWFWPKIRSAADAARIPWSAVLAVLIGLAALYTLTATWAKVGDRWNVEAPRTLDGMAYMPTVSRYENETSFSLQPDYVALRWLQDNIDGHPVVMEMVSPAEYMWGNRISIYTGLPSVVGWSWHQRQQRGIDAPEVIDRHRAVKEFYSTTDIDYAMSILDTYHVELIMVGELEKVYTGQAGIAKFEIMDSMGLLSPIFDQNGTAIYRVEGERTTP